MVSDPFQDGGAFRRIETALASERSETQNPSSGSLVRSPAAEQIQGMGPGVLYKAKYKGSP